MNASVAEPAPQARPPSLNQRVGRMLMALSVIWIVVVGAAIWAWQRHEVNELLDDGLKATSDALAMVIGEAATLPSSPGKTDHLDTPFVWQVLDRQGQLLARSGEAPNLPLAVPGEGFLAGQFGWRVLGSALPGGRWLLVGQQAGERLEAVLEAAIGTLASALLVSVAGLAWLRWRLKAYTQPLGDLADDLARYDPLRPGSCLPSPQLAELVPVHDAVHTLGRRLAAHVATEVAFNAHAAHALRTPLAGLLAQVAVALREAPPPLRPRLERLRSGAERLNRVVGALLALFRSGGEPDLQAVQMHELVARVPVEGLQVQVSGKPTLLADEDLLSAALINLLDNSLRHGAKHVAIEVQAGALVVHDDGPGVSGERLHALRAALEVASQSLALERMAAPSVGLGAGHSAPLSGTGLGLALADRVARAHGGRLELMDVGSGFAVRLVVAAEASPAVDPATASPSAPPAVDAVAPAGAARAAD